MSSFIRVAGHRLTRLVRTSARIWVADRSRSACRLDELSHVGIELDFAAPIIKDLGSLMAPRNACPEPPLHVAAADWPRALGRRQRTPRPTFVGGRKVFDQGDKAGTRWTTNPLGLPEQ